MLDIRSAGDDSYADLVAYEWQLGSDRAVIAANIAGREAQGLLQLSPLADGAAFDFVDQLTDNRYRWTREDVTGGLYVRLGLAPPIFSWSTTHEWSPGRRNRESRARSSDDAAAIQDSSMKAIVVRPGQSDTIHLRDMPDPRMKPDQVAVKMLRVGLCATDAEINHGLFGKPPDGEEFLILGHENFGVVEDVGRR